MLVEFKVQNFLSFKELQTLTMVASALKELRETNTFNPCDNMTLLRSAVMYGANASGKSNFVEAISFMKKFIINSSKESQTLENIPVMRFQLSSDTEDKPSLFEITFFHNEIKYRYGFEADQSKIHNEWLFYAPKRKEAKLFTRENDKIELGSYFKEGKGLESKTRSNALFLSVCAQFNGEISSNIFNWFLNFNTISGLSDSGYFGFTVNQMQHPDFKGKILEFLKIADLGIDDLHLKETELKESEIPPHVKNVMLKNMMNKQKNEAPTKNQKFKAVTNDLFTLHKKFDKSKKKLEIVPFPLSAESEGTKKIFALTGPIIDTLEEGKILIIDELDARLHPLITRFIIQLFHSPEKNKKNAQLLFATHDTNLLNSRFFRRDQIWFFEKDKYGATEMYSLSDFKVRSEASYNKDYILGKYGAIPFLGDSAHMIENIHE